MWATFATVVPTPRVGSVYVGAGAPTAAYASFNAVRSSAMCAALTVVLPTMRLGSVNENAGSARLARTVLIAFRSSMMWTALIIESPLERSGSVNVKRSVTLNVAVTTVAPPRMTAQGRVPEQPPPLQPANSEPPSGVAVSVTRVPLTKPAEQVAPHKILAGLLRTVPLPVPVVVAVSVKILLKVAVTAVVAETVTVQASAPEQPPPLQLLKIDPASGVAVSVTSVPLR